MIGSEGRGRRAKTFPHSGPETAFDFLRAKIEGHEIAITESARQKVLADLEVLRILDSNGLIIDLALAKDVLQNREAQIRQLLCVPGGKLAIDMIKAKPDARPEDVGGILREAYGLPWAETTTRMAGTKFRA